MRHQPGQSSNKRLGHTVAICDLDNLTNEKRQSPTNPQATLDLLGLIQALRQRGCSRGVACRNWDFSATATCLWGTFGFEVCAANDNADDKVIEAADRYADEPDIRWVIILGGDHIYADLIKKLQAKGIRVAVWSIKRKMSQSLRIADEIRYVDRWVIRPQNQKRHKRRGAAHRTLKANYDFVVTPTSTTARPSEALTRQCQFIQTIRAPQLGLPHGEGVLF